MVPLFKFPCPLLESELLRCLTEFAQDPESQTYFNDLDTAAVLERVLSLRSDPHIQIPPETTELSPALFNAVLTLPQSRDPDRSDSQRSQTNGSSSNNIEDPADSGFFN